MTDNLEDNLHIWNEVSATDPAYTKGFSAPGGNSGTAINATYMIMKATELWGPIGGKWGYSITEERFDTGAPVYNETGETLGHEMTHTLRLAFWVKDGEEKREIEHFGHTPYIYYSKRSNRFITDGEAPKKSLTDAIKKCLSMFGFSADIFMGLYDDVNYLAEIKAAFDVEKSDNAAEETIKKRQEYDEWKEKHLEFIATATNMNELELIFKSCVRKANHHDDKNGALAFTKAKDARKKELEQKKGDK